MEEIKMKSIALSKFTSNWRAAAILLALASTSNSEAMTTKHRACPILDGRKELTFRLIVPQRKQTDGWYQPPRSPGFNEDFGG
jgi:hypothetical protein